LSGEDEESRKKLMIIKKETDIPSSEVTDRNLYLT
jgi:hypothetical protein